MLYAITAMMLGISECDIPYVLNLILHSSITVSLSLFAEQTQKENRRYQNQAGVEIGISRKCLNRGTERL